MVDETTAGVLIQSFVVWKYTLMQIRGSLEYGPWDTKLKGIGRDMNLTIVWEKL